MALGNKLQFVQSKNDITLMDSFLVTDNSINCMAIKVRIRCRGEK